MTDQTTDQPSTEVATAEVVEHRGQLSERMRYAQALASASLLPQAYRAKPANVLLAMEYGDALGIAPMVAIQTIHVIEGKPTASAQLIGALVRRAGHRLRVRGDALHAVAEITRADDPDYTFTSEWTLERAKGAGLLGKNVWRQYPESMLKARAITEVARDACPEVLAGVAYTPEELGHDDDTSWSVETTAGAVATSQADAPQADVALRGSAARTVPAVPDVEDAVLVDDAGAVEGEAAAPASDLPYDVAGRLAFLRQRMNRPDAAPTKAQTARMWAILGPLGDDDTQREFMRRVITRGWESSKELTALEVAVISDAAETLLNPPEYDPEQVAS